MVCVAHSMLLPFMHAIKMAGALLNQMPTFFGLVSAPKDQKQFV